MPSLGLGLCFARGIASPTLVGPPVILGNSNTIVSGGVTWTLSAAVDYGQTVDGVAWIIVPPGGVNITARSPAATTESALAVNGTMKNPQREQQGWDARLATYSAGLNQSFPFAVAAGNIVVGQIFAPGVAATPRLGVSASYSGLICTSGGYPANTFAPALIGWSGRGTPQAYQLDVAAAVNTLPSLSLSGIPYPTVADVIAKVDRLEIGPAATADMTATGYEALLTNGLGDGSSNYGQWTGRWIGAAGLHLVGNIATNSEKQTLFRALVRHGIQWYDAVAGSGTPATPDGGHFQFQLIPVAMALHFLGRTSQLDNLSTVWPGNFFGQTFTYTASRIANLAPHSSVNLPMVSRRRTITAVAGTNITFTTERGLNDGDTARTNFAGMRLVRESDGASALITTNRAATTIAGTDDLTTIAGGSDRKGVTIDVQPGSPFLVNDVVYLQRPDPIYEGDTDWRNGGADNSIFPGHLQEYRDLNKFSDDILPLRAMGIWRSNWDSLERYVALANRSNDPSGARDYPTHHDTVNGFAFAQNFWNVHGPNILGSYPVVLTNVRITGTGEQGTVLTAVPAVVAPSTGLTRTYQWYQNTTPISGATSTTYTVQAGDVGNSITVWETISNANGSQVSRARAVVATTVYAVNAVNFDGSTSANSTSVAGPAGSTQGSIVFSFRYVSAFGAGTIFQASNAAGSARVLCELFLNSGASPPTTEGRLGITLRNSSNTVIGTFTTANSEFLAGTGYTVAVSWDTTTQTWVARKRPYGGSWSTITPATGTMTLNATTEAIGRFGLGTTTGVAGRPTNLDMADVWVGIGQRPDFTNASVLAQFLPTASKGSDGSAPTGVPPEFYFSGTTGTWHVNDGTAGGLTLSGTLTTASVLPT